MPALTKPVIMLALLACAGCAKPSDISQARRDHLLAGPHGWVDMTVHAPAALASAVAAASAPASTPLRLEVKTRGKPVIQSTDLRPNDCQFEFRVNGEAMMADAGDLVQADAAGNPLGYRFPVPAGTLDTELRISSCVEHPLPVRLPLSQGKDELSLLEFDGKALVRKSVEPYAPVTLDAVHDDVARLHDRGAASDATLARLTGLVLASIALNVVVLVVLFLRRRRQG